MYKEVCMWDLRLMACLHQRRFKIKKKKKKSLYPHTVALILMYGLIMVLTFTSTSWKNQPDLHSASPGDLDTDLRTAVVPPSLSNNAGPAKNFHIFHSLSTSVTCTRDSNQVWRLHEISILPKVCHARTTYANANIWAAPGLRPDASTKHNYDGKQRICRKEPSDP